MLVRFGGGRNHVPGKLRKHVRWVGSSSRRLARTLFIVMMIYREGLERKQRVLGRFVNIGADLFAMAATCSRAASLAAKNPADKGPVELADLFCRDAAKRIKSKFRSIYRNDDAYAYRIARNMLEGKYAWVEDGIIQPE